MATIQADAIPFQLEDFDPEQDSITSEVIKPQAAAADRSIARRASLQILYELDTTAHEPATVIEAHLEERHEAYAARAVIRRLVRGVIAHRAAIDGILAKYAPEFPIDQVAVIDRNILRLAVFEHLIQSRATPTAVIINEAVRLAQIFGAEHAHGFVHGVLGAITSDALLETVATEDLLSLASYDEATGIGLGCGLAARWDAGMRRYRALDTGRFISKDRIGEARHRVFLFLHGGEGEAR